LILTLSHLFCLPEVSEKILRQARIILPALTIGVQLLM
jgi:hypothetical protein